MQAQTASDALRFAQRTIISPSLSSAASRSDDADAERRRELSPSPEVDLSTHDFDEVESSNVVAPHTPSGSFSTHPVHQPPPQNHRANSPPLEKDEKEFTQTARGMQRRQLSRDISMESIVQPPSALPEAEYALSKQMDVDGELFGDNGRVHVTSHTVLPSSPAIKPLMTSLSTSKRASEEMTGLWTKIEEQMEWDTRSPENIELEELDDLMDEF